MKALLFTALTLVGLPLLAQTSSTTSTTSTTTTSTTAPTTPTAPTAPTGTPTPQQMMQQVMASFTPAERDQLMAAQQKAMADNPNLQTEGMNLAQKGMAIQGGTATDADKAAFRTAIAAFEVETRADMIKADPTVAPLLARIEAEGAKLRAEYSH